jgi:hypothetical protein
MKKIYQAPVAEIIFVNEEDLIVTSGFACPNELPDLGEDSPRF